MKFHLLIPLGVPLRFSETVLSFAPDKRPENIPDSIEIISGQQRLHTHTEGRFQACKCKGLSYLQRDPHIADELFSWWRIETSKWCDESD